MHFFFLLNSISFGFNSFIAMVDMKMTNLYCYLTFFSLPFRIDFDERILKQQQEEEERKRQRRERKKEKKVSTILPCDVGFIGLLFASPFRGKCLSIREKEKSNDPLTNYLEFLTKWCQPLD